MKLTVSEEIIQAFVSGRRNMQLEQLANTAPELLKALRKADSYLSTNKDISFIQAAIHRSTTIEEAEKQVAY